MEHLDLVAPAGALGDQLAHVDSAPGRSGSPRIGYPRREIRAQSAAGAANATAHKVSLPARPVSRRRTRASSHRQMMSRPRRKLRLLKTFQRRNLPRLAIGRSRHAGLHPRYGKRGRAGFAVGAGADAASMASHFNGLRQKHGSTYASRGMGRAAQGRRRVGLDRLTCNFTLKRSPCSRCWCTPPALAATDVIWWHAMAGELGHQLEKLATDFNATQSDYRIVPIYKGSYTETTTAAIFAFRSQTQPAIVQVNEIATATMMAARGAIYPVHELMRDAKETFSRRLPACGRRLLHRSRRQHAVVPVQLVDADPLLQQADVSLRRPRSGSAAENLARDRRRGATPARVGRRAASPRRGHPGSTSRIFPRSTTFRLRPGPTASAASTHS